MKSAWSFEIIRILFGAPKKDVGAALFSDDFYAFPTMEAKAPKAAIDDLIAAIVLGDFHLDRS